MKQLIALALCLAAVAPVATIADSNATYEEAILTETTDIVQPDDCVRAPLVPQSVDFHGYIGGTAVSGYVSFERGYPSGYLYMYFEGEECVPYVLTGGSGDYKTWTVLYNDDLEGVINLDFLDYESKLLARGTYIQKLDFAQFEVELYP